MQSTGLERMTCFELYAASRAMTARYRPHLDAVNLTYPQYLVLCALATRDPLTVRELGRLLHLDSGTLSPLLKRLETQGHLRRERGTADERTVWLHLTDTGRALRDHLADLPQRLGRETGLSAADFDHLHHLLHRLRGAPA